MPRRRRSRPRRRRRRAGRLTVAIALLVVLVLTLQGRVPSGDGGREPVDETPRGDAPAGVLWAIPGDARRSRAVRVVDGDTLEIAGLGSSRLIGVDTPEVYGGRECYGPAASAYVERLVPPGAPLRYTLGRDPRDRYGRALVTVWLRDGRAVNALLVERGYATTLTIAPNTRYAGRLEALERRARRQRRGQWGRCRRGA